MKMKKVEKIQNKIGWMGYKWTSLNAQGIKIHKFLSQTWSGAWWAVRILEKYDIFRIEARKGKLTERKDQYLILSTSRKIHQES